MSYFHPEPWGRWTHFDEHIFQRGWFNQQLAGIWLKIRCPFCGGDVLGFGDFCWWFMSLFSNWCLACLVLRFIGFAGWCWSCFPYYVQSSTPLAFEGVHDKTSTHQNRHIRSVLSSGWVPLEKKVGHRKNIKTLTRFFQVTLLGVLFVTFSGVKTWPQFGLAKGHLEEAGSFVCLINTRMTLLRGDYGKCPLLEKNLSQTQRWTASPTMKKGLQLQIRVMSTSGEREMDFEMDEIGGIIVIVRFTQMFN